MSSSSDINLHESGNGGEIAIVNRDFALTEQIYNQVYLALFGGMKQAVTTGTEISTEPRLDWWANPVFFGDNPAKQMNSFTEKALLENATTLKGRNNIISAVQTDLAFLQTVAETNVNVLILSSDKIKIIVNLRALQNNSNKTITFLWDNAKKEIIESQIL